MSKKHYDFEHDIENISELMDWLDENTDGGTIVKGIGGGPNHTWVDYQITSPKKVFVIYETDKKPFTYYAFFRKFAKTIAIRDNKDVFIDGINYTERDTYTDVELKTIC